MRDILSVYCHIKDREYGDEHILLSKLKFELSDRLDLDATHHSDVVELNKMIKLNRFKDLVPDNDALYQLTKQAMLQSKEEESLRILRLGLELGGADV